MAFPHLVFGSENESLKTSATKRLPLGTRMVAEDGRCYRYCENGGVAQVVGSLMQSFVPLADLQDEAIDTLTAPLTVLTGIGGTTANTDIDELVDGYFYSSTAADTNPALRIKSNTLITAAATTGTITLYEPIETNIAAASTYTAVKNPWKDVIIHLSPQTAMLTGVPVKAIAGDEFGWLCTKGPCRVLVEGTHVIGDFVVPSATTNGAVMPSAAVETDGPPVGAVIIVEATTELGLIFLHLD